MLEMKELKYPSKGFLQMPTEPYTLSLNRVIAYERNSSDFGCCEKRESLSSPNANESLTRSSWRQRARERESST
jgi:hypothetical protein